MGLYEINETENRLGKLKALSEILASAIDNVDDMRDYATLARQYRETIREIEEIEGVGEEDEIAEILQKRRDNGQAGAVRADRSKV